ncbi:MAG: ORF6N domain-containing protein [Candidatus Omnitrophica bacterium]|nr:ORF6N domain-containing protein [Candidatus Omnitrophota bacterium]
MKELVPVQKIEQVKRNRERFLEDFMFQLTHDEKQEVVAICDHLRNLKFYKGLPYAFTKHGALMAANVLNSRRYQNYGTQSCSCWCAGEESAFG